MQSIKRTESFQIIEDRPPNSPVHPDKKIQEAVQPCWLVKDSQGKQFLMFDRKSPASK